MAQAGVIRAAVGTGATGTQDFRDPNMTETPNAAILILTNALTDGTPADTALISVGLAATTVERVNVLCRSTNGGASTSTRRRAVDAIIQVADDSNTVVGQADFSSFLADVGAGAGIQINVTNAFESAYLLTIILLAIDDVFVGTYTTGAAASDTTAVTDPAFLPDAVIAISSDTTIPGATNPLLYSLGFAVNGSGQNCVGMREGNGAGTGQPSLRIAADRLAIEVDVSGNEVWGSELTSWDANGFTVTQRTAGGGGDEVGYMALNLGSLSAWAGTVTSPTSTGSQSITSPGFTPILVILLLSTGEETGTGYTDNRAGSWGAGAFTANGQYSNTVQIEDAADTTNTQSLSNDVAVDLPDDDGVALCTASFVSMDSAGWTLNHTAVAATGKVWPAFAIGSVSAAGWGRLLSGERNRLVK